jgi:polyhydroxyalkanoate synthase
VLTTILGEIAGQYTAAVTAQQRFLERVRHLPRARQIARETRVGTTPYDLVFSDGPRRLLRLRRESPALYAEPVLFCYALINRPYILDLQPGKSVVERYLERGFEVYLIDWGVPTDDDRAMRLEHYVCGFLKRAVDTVTGAHARKTLHLIGYCMGGTMSTIFSALYPELVRSLTLLASPIDFAGDALLNVWTNPRYLCVDELVDAHGNCPAALLQTCFVLLKPVQNLLEKHLTFFEHLDDPKFVANYYAVEHWVNDNIPVAGETFREFVKKLYQANELVRGMLHVGDTRVDLARIACPLLLLTAEGDHLVPPASTDGLAAHVSSHDVTSMMINAGHVGLAVSSKAHKTLWPNATRWLAERSELIHATVTRAPFAQAADFATLEAATSYGE